MPILLIRAIILYFTVVLMIRLMGKRQIGELQPSELVVTILISEIASQPVQDPSVSVAGTIATLVLLVSLEIITSAINLKSSKLRTAMQGHPVIVIRDGKIAMMHSRKYDYYKLPGGGIEPGETLEETLIREVREESGLVVKIETIKEFGYVRRIEKD